jgi:hypothetical protein
VALELNTARGPYRLKQAREPERACAVVVMTLVLESRDGLETVGFRCRVGADAFGGDLPDDSAILGRIGAWLERDFEQVREAALKSIRSEGKILEIALDQSDYGPA